MPGERRLAEYTPTSDWKLSGGQADKYGRLLTEELLPFIAARYRVRPGAANTGLGGSSLGGLVTLYLGLQFEEVFGKLAVLAFGMVESSGDSQPGNRSKPKAVWEIPHMARCG